MFKLFDVLREEAGDAAAGAGDVDADKAGDTSADGLLGDAAAKAAAEKAAAADPNKQVVTRPDDIPEQFWDAKTGAVRADALSKAWKDTRKELELAKKAHTKAPEKVEDYKYDAPADSPIKLDAKDPALNVFRNVAHAAGLSQEQYAAILGGFLDGMKEHVPAETKIDIEAEKKKLGPNADAIAAAVLGWGNQFVDNGLWSKDEFDEIVIMGSTAAGLKALNKLREHMGEKPIPVDAVDTSGLPSKDELYAKVGDPRYASDETFRKKVDAEFVAVFGNEPAGTSERGIGVRPRAA